MKLWLAMFVVIILIILGGLFMERSILKTTDGLSHSLDQIQAHVRDDQWQEALHLNDQVLKRWSRQQEVWSPFIHNQDLDVVATHLARLQSFLESAEKGSSLAEISVIKLQLVQLHHQEVLTLQNIF